MQSHSPKISVLLAVYNGERYVKDATSSVLLQTFGDFELIIIDDGSSDGTPKILNSFTDPRIVIVSNEKNEGLIKSLNKGIKMARGEYLARMDADDISHPQRFEKQINYMEANRGIGVLGTAVNHVDEKNKIISTLIQPQAHESILWKMFFECAIIHPTVIARKEVIEMAGGYDVRFPHIEDTELWMRVADKTRFSNIPDVLHSHRLHKKSIGSTKSSVQYESGLLLRKRFIASTIGVNMPPNVNKWFSENETILSGDDIAAGMGILLDIYEYILDLGFENEESRLFVRNDFLKKAAALMSARKRRVSKTAVSLLKKILPSPLRHKLKTRFMKLAAK